MVKIIAAPNDILSQKAARVIKINKEISSTLSDMKTALLSAKDPEGVGLAAPQIGKSLSIFLIRPTPKSVIKVFINPKILSEEEKSKAKRGKGPTKLEGCLSLPGIWGEVKRKSAITLSYMDVKGNMHTDIFKGFVATIIQHEIDHLNGILFTKRVLEQNGTLYKSHKNEKGQDEFEELEL